MEEYRVQGNIKLLQLRVTVSWTPEAYRTGRFYVCSNRPAILHGAYALEPMTGLLDIASLWILEILVHRPCILYRSHKLGKTIV